MRFLVLGGTRFLGRHVVDAAVLRRHDVTLFNRGQTDPALYPELVTLRGDRARLELDALRGRAFDAVVDTSGFVPRVVRATIEALGDVGHYTFVSTMSVYREHDRNTGEHAPVAQLPEETEEVRRDTYGPLKALCEDVVRARFPDAFVARPGLIAGPWDPTGRFTYWPLRYSRPGPVLAPSPPTAATQLIDARDLARWIVTAAEERLAGTYNAVAPSTSLADVLESCRRAAGSEAETVWVDGDFLVEQRVEPWGELPLWAGPDSAELMRAPVKRALTAGLQIRPPDDTARDTLAWAKEHAPEQPGTLTPEKEQAVLAAWYRRTRTANGVGSLGPST